MNKLTYGTYSNNADTPFLQEKGYVDPASGEQTRRQLGQPLREIKEFLDDTMPVDTSNNVAQLQVSSSGLKYRTTSGGSWSDVGGGLKLTDVYPVGSIYLTVNNTNPSTWITGTTWVQIKDTFLLGAGDTYTGGATGGEATHTLTVEEIPSHAHNYTLYKYNNLNNATGSSSTFWNGTNTVASSSTGGGEAHNNMPPYLVVYMWKRTA